MHPETNKTYNFYSKPNSTIVSIKYKRWENDFAKLVYLSPELLKLKRSKELIN